MPLIPPLPRASRRALDAAQRLRRDVLTNKEP